MPCYHRLWMKENICAKGDKAMNMSNRNNEEIFETRPKRFCMSLCDRFVTTDISNDYTLPDYQPEIRRILNISAVATPPAKYISATGAEFNGNVDYNILYIGGDGELHTVSLDAAYGFNVPIDTDGFDFNEGITSLTDGEIQNVTTRLVGPRKLNIKCRIKSHASAYGTFVLDEKVNGSVPRESVEILEESCENAKIIRGSSDILELSEEIICDNPEARIVGADSNVLISSVTPYDGSVNVQGEVYLKVLCSDSREPCMCNNITQRVPFSISMEIDDITPKSFCSAKGYVSDISVNAEDGRAICDLSMFVDVQAQTPVTVNYVKDMYSTQNESNCFFRDYNVPTCGYGHNGNFSMNERVLRSNLSMPDDCRIVDVSATALVENTEVANGRATVYGNVKYTLILCCDKEYSSMDIVLPTKYEFEVDADNDFSCASSMSVLFCRARMDIDNLSLDAEIGVSSLGVGSTDIMTLDEISFGAEITRRKGEITVCYKSEDDSLWNIAKKYHMPSSHIERMNALNGNIEDRKYVVI